MIYIYSMSTYTLGNFHTPTGMSTEQGAIVLVYKIGQLWVVTFVNRHCWGRV